MIRIPFIAFILLLFSCETTKQTTDKEPNNTKDNLNDSIPSKTVDTDDYFDEGYNTLNTEIFYDEIKTVLAHKKNWDLSESTMMLNGNDTLVFSFDELTSDLGSYYYTIMHCNADWTKSDLIESEYIDGFFQDFISNFKYSFNTLTQYIHYQVEIPNKNMKPTKSGNYIFKVYNDNNPDDVVLTKRFMIYENIIETEAIANRPSIIDDRDDKQEIDFSINIGEMVVNNLYTDLKVVVMQNNRWDNAITDLKPLFIRGGLLNYDYNKENVFNGLNEYRFLNTRTLRYRGQKVKLIEQENKSTNVFLFKEEKRTYKNHITYQDLNGGFKINIQEGIDSRVEADYANVYFSIESPTPDLNGDVYVFGGISNYNFEDRFKMRYNSATKAFECNTLLKQGYYDYHYLVKRPGGEVDIPFFEGNHFETINNYTIITYLRDQKQDYDRIIGYHSFMSNAN